MAAEPTPASAPQPAHALYLDLVGISELPEEAREFLADELEDVVRLTSGFGQAEASGQVVYLPTASGAAVVYLRDALGPLQAALQIRGALPGRPQLRLRLGLHTGPFDRSEDARSSATLSGGTVEAARRLAACGGAGQILLSGSAAETLPAVREFRLDDLGECPDGRGGTLRVLNLRIEQAGGGAPPGRVVARPGTPAVIAPGAPAAAEVRPAAPHSGPGAGFRAALLHDFNAPADDRLARFLAGQLVSSGFEVYVESPGAMDVDWAENIERQARESDVVVPFLSESSIHSELLAYLVQLACDTAQEHYGRPRLLPIRVDYSGPLPEPMADILQPLEAVSWRQPADDDWVARDLVELMQQLTEPAPAVPGATLKADLLDTWPWNVQYRGVVSGSAIDPRMAMESEGKAVALQSKYYLARPVDGGFRYAIAMRESIILVKGVRQTGKTSLLARGLQQARESGVRVVATDFQKLSPQRMESAGTLFRTLAESILEQLNLEVELEGIWDPRRGASLNLERFLEQEILGELSTPTIWGMDGIDRLFDCPFAEEIFNLFWGAHDRRQHDPWSPWARLTLALCHAEEPRLHLRDLKESPFSVGARFLLKDLTIEQVAELNGRYGSPLPDEDALARFHRLLAGHPYLVRLGLHEMAARAMSIDAVEGGGAETGGIFADHLRRVLLLLGADPELRAAAIVALKGQALSEESFCRLRSAGIVTGDSAAEARPRCPVYESFLRRCLL